MPETRSGLPHFLEKRLAGNTGDSAFARMMAAGKLRAIGVLVRKHPRAVFDALSAGIWQAGRVGVDELLAAVASKRVRTENPELDLSDGADGGGR
ncbi:hypothetical protein [Brucella sp. IR073]|uniref:hypothetical protein n=1 Tax=unclassified Brucella TaxID=2632610 RepID=UPI003B981B92